jgi:HemY protein
MKRLLWLIILLAAAVAIAVSGRLDTGQISILYAPYRIDLSLSLFCAAIIATFIVFYLLIRFARNIFGLPARLAAYRAQVQTRKAHAALLSALRDLFAGRFTRAEKTVRTPPVIKHHKEAGALIGAWCTHKMQAIARCDAWLAQITAANWKEAKWVTIAEIRLERQDAAGALAALEQIDVSRRLHAQQIALRAHLQLAHWPEVLQLVNVLDARGGLPPDEVRQLRQTVAQQGLQANDHDPQALLAYWKTLPEDIQRVPHIADLGAQLLLRCGQHKEARRIVENALNQHWDARLLRRYPECAEDDPLLSLQRAEAWQVTHPDDPELFFALGHLCQQQKLWGKAQAFLETTLRLAGSQQHTALKKAAHLALACLYETLDDHSAANKHYRASARGE